MIDLAFEMPMKRLGIFWWAFAARGGLAILFSAVLLYTGSLFGSIFLDPIMFVALGMLLGFYILGNGVLLGVAAGYAAEHRIGIWKVLLAECIFTTALGTYIGFTLIMSSLSLAWLAGLHAFGTGCFLAVLAYKLRANRLYGLLLASAGLLSLCVGTLFLGNRYAATRSATEWLAAFELFYGLIMLLFAFCLHRCQAPTSLTLGISGVAAHQSEG